MAEDPEVSDLGPSADGRTLWHGRLTQRPSDALLAFTASLSFDERLAADDLAGSRAHVRMLGRARLLDAEEVTSILDALDRVEAELAAGDLTFLATDEDIHTVLERRVTELAGDAGAKLHTGRSRNDQVATATRLFVRREGEVLLDAVLGLQQVLATRAATAGADAYLPGYTHLQRAQPVLLGHHLLAHFWAFTRDVERLESALARADVSPLGAGALAGSSLPLDPDGVAAELGFSRRFENSLDAVSDRDFVAELCFVCSLVMVHLSRIGEEVVLWSSDEFGFLSLADDYATGSSMLPQKKNPDIAELARGKAGRVIGNVVGVLTTLKGLPLSYNRDLQEDKEALFDTLETTRLALVAVAGMLESATFHVDVMRAAADTPAVAATDLAEWLVARGMAFRAAHAVVGSLVRQASERGVPLEELVMTEPLLGPDALGLLEPGQAVGRRRTPGGGGPEPFGAQLAAAQAWLGAHPRVDAAAPG